MVYPYFPIFTDLTDKCIVVVGAGQIAARRVKTLTGFAPMITVIAPGISDELKVLAEAGKIRIRERCFAENDLDGADLVLAATDDRELNSRIFRLCRERHIPVNNAGDQTECDFFFPGIVQKDAVVVGVTASGQDHRKAREITGKIRRLLDSVDSENQSEVCQSPGAGEADREGAQ